jgi:hypothetical protein
MLGASKSIWGFNPVSAIPGCTLWLDGSDSNTMFQNTGGTTPVTGGGQAVQLWRDKSVNSNHVTGTGTWSGSNMVFNGSTNAFSNLTYVFPFSSYSLFAVYSNTVAPAAAAYMNVMYGSNGFPMLGTFGSNRNVSARSVVANTGALLASPVGWAARIGGTGSDSGRGIATDILGNVVVTGPYGAAVTIFNQGASGTAGSTLPSVGNQDVFVAKYNSIGNVQWAARIGSVTGNEDGTAIATDSLGNVFVIGYYQAALTIYNQGPSGAGVVTLPFTGLIDCFVAKYLPDGTVSWAARIAGTTTSADIGRGIATDSLGNVFVIGYYQAALTIYNQGPSGAGVVTLPFTGVNDCFIAKYLPDGTVSWAARIAGAGNDVGYAIATDSSGNVLVTGTYGAAVTIYNQGPSGAGVVTLPLTGSVNVFIAKYLPDGTVSWAARIAGTVGESGYGIATDSSGNVLVTGTYASAVTIYNQGPSGAGVVTLPFTGVNDCFIAKYLPDGTVSWAARIGGTQNDEGYAIATDSLGNVFVTGTYGAAVTIYNQGPSGAGVVTLPFTGTTNSFIAKYLPDGTVSWAARIAGPSISTGNGIATDSLGNVLVTGRHADTVTFYNQGGDGVAAITLTNSGVQDVFIAKYNPDGFIANFPTPANSNVLVDATYLPSTMSPFINGNAQNTLAGTTLATTGVFIGGPSNYFNGTLSELLIYNNTLNISQRQGVEGYLANKWGLRSKFPLTQPYLVIPPFSRYFAPMDIPGCTLWMDGSDPSTMNSTSAVTIWNDKSGSGNNMSGSGTWSGSNMVFNGSTNAFSNLGYVFPFGAYSMFAVYSNTTAPAAAAYMNVVYGNGGFPMLGTFGSNKFVSARSVVANTGALGANVGWAARIAGTGGDTGHGIATDSSQNVIVIGSYSAALTFYNQGAAGAGVVTLPVSGVQDCFIAKYSSIGNVQWAARIASTASDIGYGIATDTSGNIVVTGFYQAALTFSNQGPSGAAVVTLPNTGNPDGFVAKYLPDGTVSWAARFTCGSTVIGRGIATDPSGNVVIGGDYNGFPVTFSNQGSNGTAGPTLPYSGSGAEGFVAKYLSDGTVSWAARISSIGGLDSGQGVATDSSGNVLVAGYYQGIGSFYNQSGGQPVVVLSNAGSIDAFVAKYNSIGNVMWAARIGGADADWAYAIAVDPSGNVVITGEYRAAVTFYNQGSNGTSGATLPFTGGFDCFVAKYLSDGTVSWAARIAGTKTSEDVGRKIATDSSGDILVTGYYGAALTIYNKGSNGTPGATLPLTGTSAVFITKYLSDGTVSWATRIVTTTTAGGFGLGITTDMSRNVLVTGNCASTATLYNRDGTIAITLPFIAANDVFVAKYNPDGFITGPIPASSNVLVDATYLPSTMSPFINGTSTATLAGTTLATTGIFLGGPSNYFNGSLSELLIYSSTLTSNQRQQVEGYLLQKWGLRSQIISTQPYTIIPPATLLAFSPTVIPGCAIWLDAADNLSMNSTTTVTLWRDKSGNSVNMAGTATWTGSNMSFNGSTQQFSNTTYVFPSNAYSMFAVYSNTTAPTANAYMNVVYGSNGYPMLGTFGVNRDVTARSVVANTGALTPNVAASSNILVSATYLPSTMSPFINGTSTNTLAGSTLATTGIFICGPTSRFNGTLSELVIYARTLTTDQRQQVEGYLARKWGITLPITHPYYAFGPFMT